MHIHAETAKHAVVVGRSPDTAYRDQQDFRNIETSLSAFAVKSLAIDGVVLKENQHRKEHKRHGHYTQKDAPCCRVRQKKR